MALTMMAPAALFECRHVVECTAHPHPNHPDAVFRDDKLSCFDWICKVSLDLFWRLNLLFRTLTALAKRCAHLTIVNNIFARLDQCLFFLFELCCHDQMLLKKNLSHQNCTISKPISTRTCCTRWLTPANLPHPLVPNLENRIRSRLRNSRLCWNNEKYYIWMQEVQERDDL